MKINWWNVAAVFLLANAFIGMCAAIILEAGFIWWALANMVAFGVLRLERLYHIIAESNDSYESEEPYG